MSTANGFMIPLNQSDWTNSGQRMNWCDPSNAWYLNGNIFLKTLAGNFTVAPQVSEAVTIQVGIQGVIAPPGTKNLAALQKVQAWACYPSPTSGTSAASLVLPSMQSSNPTWTGQQPIVGADPVSNPGDYQTTDGLSFAYYLASLSPTWTPTSGDLVPPNTAAHCCIIANSAGVYDAQSDGNSGYLGYGAGSPIPNNAELASLINICNFPYQGQLNIAIVPLPIGQIRTGSSLVREFGFLAAGLRTDRPTQAVLEVTSVRQLGQVDPAVLRVLKAGPHRDLFLQPASSGLKGLRLSKNNYECQGHLARLILEAEEIAEEVIEALEHPFRHTSRLRLKLPPKGVQPMLLRVELDASLPPGSVHTFDITQTDKSGKCGGIRVAAIVVP